MDEGRIGHLLFVNMSMWIMNPRESSAFFHLKALHPHTVDVMRYFCGDVEAVQCFATIAPGRTLWSTAQFNMRFKNGVVGSLTGSYDITFTVNAAVGETWQLEIDTTWLASMTAWARVPLGW